MFTLQGHSIETITSCDNIVFTSETVGSRWNCDSAWFNLKLEYSEGSLRWN